MEYNIAINVDEGNFPNDNSLEVSEGTQVIKIISFQDSDEENFGRMKEYFRYLEICDNQLKINSKETNLNSSQ